VISDQEVQEMMETSPKHVSVGWTEGPLEVDVKGNLYKTSLRAISTYKADELKALCQEKDISLTDEVGKVKKKARLYEDLYLYEVTHP